MQFYHWLGAEAERVKAEIDLKRRHKGPKYTPGPMNLIPRL